MCNALQLARCQVHCVSRILRFPQIRLLFFRNIGEAERSMNVSFLFLPLFVYFYFFRLFVLVFRARQFGGR